MGRSNISAETRRNQLTEINRQINDLQNSLNEAAAHRWDIDEKSSNLEETREQTYLLHLKDTSEVVDSMDSRARIERVRQLDREWERNQKEINQQLHSVTELNTNSNIAI